MKHEKIITKLKKRQVNLSYKNRNSGVETAVTEMKKSLQGINN